MLLERGELGEALVALVAAQENKLAVLSDRNWMSSGREHRNPNNSNHQGSLFRHHKLLIFSLSRILQNVLYKDYREWSI